MSDLVDQMEDDVDVIEADLENIEGETKAEKFLRLAPMRYRKTVKRIRLLSNLAGPSYEFDGEQVATMFEALRKELAEAEAKFQGADETIFDPFAT